MRLYLAFCVCKNGMLAETHRNWEDQVLVSSQISNMTVQRDVFLRSTSFAYGQRYSKNRIGPKLSWETHRGGCTMHGCSLWPRVQKQCTCTVYHCDAWNANKAYICFRCHPFRSWRCPVSLAPTHWSPRKRLNSHLQNRPFIIALLQHPFFKWINFCTHRLDEGWSEGIIDMIDSFSNTFDRRTEGNIWIN